MRKRFRAFLDEPETWELKLLGKQDDPTPAPKKAEEEEGLDASQEDKDTVAHQPRKRARRNAIKPDSITHKVVKDVADSYALVESAAATGD